MTASNPYRTERLIFKANTPIFPELKSRVKQYFDAHTLDQTGNSSLIFKAIFFLGTYLAAYAILLLPIPGWVALLLCLYMGWAAAGIGFNLMHDGAHGSFSGNDTWNQLAAYSINLLGGDALLWKNKHNMIHHTYTNIEGYDQDIAMLPVLRSNVLQKKLAMHKFQHIYCFAAYALSSILWIFLLDFIKYFSGKVGNIPLAQVKTRDHIVFWCTKLFYGFAYIAVPIYVWGFPQFLIGFFAYHTVLGITLSVVFQLAHMVEETEFTTDHYHSNLIDDEWAIHQLKTTANFATRSSFISWYTGGLNFQVEHHLFPKVSHVHYPALNQILKAFCTEKELVYNEFATFGSALKSHLNHLKTTGNS